MRGEMPEVRSSCPLPCPVPGTGRLIPVGFSKCVGRNRSTKPEEPHFWLNVAGIVVTVVLVLGLLQRLRAHPFTKGVVHVWDLKQVLNRIYRRERKLAAAAEAGDPEALTILNFFYRGSKQLYELDDKHGDHERARQKDSSP